MSSAVSEVNPPEMNVQTYLFFDGCCEEAIDFYRQVFGAQLRFLMRFKDGPPSLMLPGSEEKVFHATVQVGETTLNMSDAPATNKIEFGGFALLAHFDSVEDAEKAFLALKSGGQVRMPLEQNFWAARYGIVKDRFGMTWKIQVNA